MPIPRASWPEDAQDLFEFGLDSLRAMRLLVFVEEEFGVRIPEGDITAENISSVDALAALVERFGGR